MLITKPKSSSEQFIVVCVHLSEWWPNLFLLLLRKNAAKWQNIIFLLEAEHDWRAGLQPVSLTPDRFHSSIMHQDYSGDKRAFFGCQGFVWSGQNCAPTFCDDAVEMMVGRRSSLLVCTCRRVRAETACLGMTRAWRTHACIQMWLVHHICYFVEKHEMHTRVRFK